MEYTFVFDHFFVKSSSQLSIEIKNIIEYLFFFVFWPVINFEDVLVSVLNFLFLILVKFYFIKRIFYQRLFESYNGNTKSFIIKYIQQIDFIS